MLYKVFDFAAKEAADVMVPRPDVVALSVEMPAGGGAPRRARLAVHALPGLPRVARRHLRHPARARPHLGAERLRDRRVSSSPSCSGPRTSCPRRRIWAPCSASSADEPAHGDRRRRVRLDDGHRHAGGHRRGDRRRHRGRVRPARRVGRADRRDVRSGSTARSRSTTSTRSSAPTLEHEDFHTIGGLRLRPPRPGRRAGRRGARGRASAHRARGRGVAHRAACEVEFLGEELGGRRRARRGRAAAEPPGPRDAPRFALATSVSTSSPRSPPRSRSRCRSWRSAGRSTTSAATRSISGSSASRCSCPLPLLALPAGHVADRFPRRTVFALAIGDDAVLASGSSRSPARARRRLAVLPPRLRDWCRLGDRGARRRARDAVARAAETCSCVRSRVRSVALPGRRDRRARARRAALRRRPELVYGLAAVLSLVSLVAILALRAGATAPTAMRPTSEPPRRRPPRAAHAGAVRGDLARPLRRALRWRRCAASGLREGRPRRRARPGSASCAPRRPPAPCLMRSSSTRRPSGGARAGRSAHSSSVPSG